MNLEEIVGKLSDRFKVSPKYRQVGLEFLNDRLDWLARHEVYQTLTESVVEDELQYFYRMRGAILIITAEGPKRIRAVSDLYLLRPFEIGIVNKERRHDPELFRLDRRISERNRSENGPSRGELIDQLGQTQQLRSYFHRPVSYDDVLRVREVMRRYLTGQRAVTIQIGPRSIQMMPETQDDFWVLNPSFIKLRINGALVNEKLYYFWRSVESDGKSNGRDNGKNGSEPAWPALINREGRRSEVINYSGIAVTWEAVASNPKARFIKNGQLPKSELVRLGVLAVPGKRGRKAEGEAAEKAEGETASPPQAVPPVISYEEFIGYVPKEQLAAMAFRAKVIVILHERPVSGYEVRALAEQFGIPPSKCISYVKEIPRVVELLKGPEPEDLESVEDIKNAPVYYGLGGKESIKQVFSDALRQAVREIRPDYVQRAVNQTTSRLMSVLEEGGVRNKGDLEELLQEGWTAIQAVKGLVNYEPNRRKRLAYFLLACQNLGYDVPPEAVAASPLKYFGKDSEPVKDAFRPYVEQAIRELHGDWSEMSVTLAAGGTIYILEDNGILLMLQLEELLQEGWTAIQAVKGLVSANPGQRERLAYFLLACQNLKYKVPPEAVAASPLKYFGKDSKPVKDAFRDPLEQAIKGMKPDYDKRFVHQSTVGGIISTLERGGIIFMSDLEERIRGGESGVKELSRLFGTSTGKNRRLNYFLGALEISGLYSRPTEDKSSALVKSALQFEQVTAA